MNGSTNSTRTDCQLRVTGIDGTEVNATAAVFGPIAKVEMLVGNQVIFLQELAPVPPEAPSGEE